MAKVEFHRVTKSYGPSRGHPRRRPRGRRRRVHRHRRTVRLRQVDGPAHGRRTRDGLRRGDRHRRPRGQRARAQGPRHRDGVPELRALSAHERVRQHGLRPTDPRHVARRDRGAREARGRHPRARDAARAAAAPAVGRPAAARRDGPRDRPRTGGLPVRRAAVEPRRQAARPDALRDPEAASAAAHDEPVRDARPGRGDDARPADGRHQCRARRADRHADGGLRESRDPVRRRLHRLAVDEFSRWPLRGRRPHRARAWRRRAAFRRRGRGGSESNGRDPPGTSRSDRTGPRGLRGDGRDGRAARRRHAGPPRARRGPADRAPAARFAARGRNDAVAHGGPRPGLLVRCRSGARIR